jgi:hypothetical protein
MTEQFLDYLQRSEDRLLEQEANRYSDGWYLSQIMPRYQALVQEQKDCWEPIPLRSYKECWQEACHQVRLELRAQGIHEATQALLGDCYV